MISKISKLLLILATAALVLWQLPYWINYLRVDGTSTPFTIYSCLEEQFVMIKHQDGKAVKCGVDGTVYSDKEFDSILPAFYVRQLMTDGRFPDTVLGRAVTAPMLIHHNFNFRSSPREINKPLIGLYPLIESMSKRVDLEMPADLFRISGSRIEFVIMESNSVDEKKSERFTEELLEHGFAFPALGVAGNPTTRKEYDEGYLLIDANHQVYHMKMTVGRPFVRNVVLPEGVTIDHAFLTEYRDRTQLGLLVDSEDRVYLLTSDHQTHLLPIERFDPTTQSMTIFGNLFDWTVRVASPEANIYYAIDADDLSLLKVHRIDYDDDSFMGLHFTSPYDKYVRPRF